MAAQCQVDCGGEIDPVHEGEGLGPAEWCPRGTTQNHACRHRGRHAGKQTMKEPEEKEDTGREKEQEAVKQEESVNREQEEDATGEQEESALREQEENTTREQEECTAREHAMIGFFSWVGFLRELLIDQHMPFMSRLMSQICHILGVKHICTSVFHPKTDRLVERNTSPTDQ
ncbi:hypothetical protein NDU88_003600 [Pleurodeles waltl]|uniref:Uncharacterized protein n=1 Tax=Pleurodeles waltl TaxID=8319 RepID=A0AAV7W575_PLEWA|nr:hypothetical protein NDU88_003600 [Pleurodeles waltl]